jgi:dipeptidyl aminopeptidase/acylaminoacyl peptidase
LTAASPISYADQADPPALFVHGAADGLVPVSQSQDMAARLRAAGGKAELLVIEGVDHGLVGPSPADTRRALRQGLEATWAFLDAHLLAQAR